MVSTIQLGVYLRHNNGDEYVSATTAALVTGTIISMFNNSFESVPIRTVSVPLSSMVCIRKGGDEAVILTVKILGLKNYISFESMDSGRWPNGKIIMKSSVTRVEVDKNNNAAKIFAKSTINGNDYELELFSRDASSLDSVALSITENGKAHQLSCAAVPPPQTDPSM